MIVSPMNFFSLCLLAICGAMLVVAARRILVVIKQTERRIAHTVDQKNAVATELRLAKRDEAQIKAAIDEADGAITQMTAANTRAEARIEKLKGAEKLVVNMADNEWRKFDRFFRVTVSNPTMPAFMGRGPGSATGWSEGRVVHGFARSDVDFKERVLRLYPPSAGFVVGEAEMTSLLDDDPPGMRTA
ncbi:MAG TPA: hypothetical protein VEB20_04655 [Azospirillaceae bacterium]|nr:hypothetical protein [Azospirillaceae bacterium]